VWMKNDVRREINLAHASEVHKELLIHLGIAGGGSLLAGLGLVVYGDPLEIAKESTEATAVWEFTT
jgi:hypothetical protein